MKLPVQSINKLFRECFPGESPIQVDLKKRTELAKQWYEKLSRIDGVRLANHPGDRDSRSRTLCRFTIPEPHLDHQYWRTDELRLETNDDHQLILTLGNWRRGDHVAVVSSIDEIADLVRQTLQRYARRQASDQKRDKVRQFKSKAILAQVEKMADEDRFDYAATTDTKKLKLYVRLSKTDLIEIVIPFARFEQVVPKLRDTITTMRELHQNGLRFRTSTKQRLPYDVRWVVKSDA
ncbi:hypothetical protein [Neorhodopirellula pilleata]|uniref:Uncharacterized protein n=1 Tax=Neorhodopirellula pilleata TaxID=2714738 RepID=A0A5C6A4L2_9BACT|nr:hypothetical protein [Neorhodopirellula pilleata]TWT94376.1 hypothetical protein Pla100_39880 [Neorhodopirellula pilleata]